MADRGAFGAGVGKLRMSMILYFIGVIVVLVGSFLGAFSLLSFGSLMGTQSLSSYPGYSGYGGNGTGFNYGGSGIVSQTVSAIIGSILPGVIAAIVGFLLSLIAIIFLRSGFKGISGSNKTYGIGSTGALLQLIGFLLFLIGFIVFGALLFASPATAIAGTLGMLALVAIGGIISFIGVLMVLIGFWRLGSANNSGLVQVGAILYLIFPFIGVILLMIGLNPNALKK